MQSSEHNPRLSQLLEQKAQKLQLAHFYLFEFPDRELERENFITDWLIPFLAKLFEIEQPTPSKIFNHPDLLILGRTLNQEGRLNLGPENGTYTVEDIATVTSFASSVPWQSRWKITLIFDAHRLQDIASNKLLKILEEPSPQNTLILLDDRKTQFLPTIRSRALRLRFNRFVSAGQKSEPATDYRSLPLHQLINEINSPQELADYFYEVLFHATGHHRFQTTNKILELQQTYQQSQLFNNPQIERICLLYLFDKSLPR